MIQIVLHRSLSLVIACSDGMRWVQGDTIHRWQDKSADRGRAHVVGWIEGFVSRDGVPAGACFVKCNEFNTSSAIGHHFTDADRHDRAE